MRCKVCSSKWKTEINTKLINRERSGESIVEIAKCYMNISEKSMQRHAAKHLPTLKPAEIVGHSALSLEDMLEAATDMYSRAVLANDSKVALSR
jgi:hypothetical protein